MSSYGKTRLPSKYRGYGTGPSEVLPPSGMSIWYRADTVVLTGNNILGYVDKSGNAVHATVQSGADTATYVASSLNGQAGSEFGSAVIPYYNFAGTTPTFPIGSAGSVVLVAKNNGDTVSGFSVPMSLISGGGGESLSIFFSNQAGYGQYTIGGGSLGAANINIASFSGYNTPFYTINNYNGAGAFDVVANWAVYVNNVLTSTTLGAGLVSTLSSTQSRLGIFMTGTELPFAGNFYDLIIYPFQLDSTQRTQVAAYIAARYGL